MGSQFIFSILRYSVAFLRSGSDWLRTTWDSGKEGGREGGNEEEKEGRGRGKVDCLQSAFSLEVSRVIIPSKRVRKKWSLNEKRLGRDEKRLACSTAVKREKFVKNKKNTSKERLSLLLFKVWYFTSILPIYSLFWEFTKKVLSIWKWANSYLLMPFVKASLSGCGAFEEGYIGVCGVAVFLSFLRSIPVNKIPHCGVAVIPNPTVCDAGAFKPKVFGETKLFAVLRHRQYQHSLNSDHALWTVHRILWCACYPENSWGNDIDCLAKYCITCRRFPVFKKPYRPC